MGVKTFNRANPNLKQIETYQDFSGGLNTELADSATKDNQFRKLVNFDMDKAGSISKRPGLYRLPGISKTIMDKLNWYVKQGELDQNDILTLTIHDCTEFYDGSHWVFNYITSIGLIVVILNQSLYAPLESDLVESEYVLFYKGIASNKSETYNAQTLGNRIRISKFNDSFVMYSSIYTQVDRSSENDVKQVRLFSWNPINEDYDQIDGTVIKVRPGWVEATDNPDEIITNTQYGDSTTTTITSNQFDWLNNDPNITNTKVEITPGEYISPVFGEYDDFDISYDDTNDGGGVIRVSASTKLNKLNSKWIVVYKSGVNVPKNIIYQVVPNTLPEFSLNSINIHLEKNSEKCYLINVDYTIPNNLKITYHRTYGEVGTDKGFDNTVSMLPKGQVLDYKKYVESNKIFTPDIALVNWTQRYYFDWEFDGYYKRDGMTRSNSILITNDGVLIKEINKSLGSLNVFLPIQIGDKNEYGRQWNDAHSYTNVQADLKYNSPAFGSLVSVTKIHNKEIKRVRPIVNLDWWEETTPLNSWYTNFGVVNKVFAGFGTASYNFLNGNSFYLPERIKADNFKISSYTRYYNQEKNSTFLPGALGDYKGFSYIAEPSFNTNDLKYKNKVYNENEFGIGSGYNTLKVNDTYFNTLRSAIIKDNQFRYRKITNNNVYEYFHTIGFPVQDFLQSYNYYGHQLFSVEQLKQVDTMWKSYANGTVVKMKLVVAYKEKTLLGESIVKYLKSNLQIYELDEFSSAVLNKLRPCIVIKSIKIEGNVKVLQVYWINTNTNEETFLFELDASIPYYVENPSQVLETLQLQIVYEHLPSGYFDRVLSFKQLAYTKPNLSDLKYLWYNLNLFSKYNSSRYPDIYNNIAHPNISWDLVSYPSNTLLEARVIELFGIVPVNNIILAPGKQKFQLFYNVAETNITPPVEPSVEPPIEPVSPTANLIAAITSMSISDYTSMIASNDFTTDGKDGTQSPNWVPFDSAFKSYDDQRTYDKETNELIKTPKRAVFELDIPSTQKPYMVLIQVAKKVEPIKPDTGDKPVKPKPDISSLLEVKIEMSPEGSAIQKLEINSLFDEYTSTTNLTGFSSYLLAYGSSNKLFLSDVASPSYFPLSNIISMKTPEAVQGCTQFQGKLIVSTENSKSYIGGSSFDSNNDPLYLREISTDSGLIASKSEVSMGNYLYFLDASGIKILKNLYGTADKEFSFETIDTIIKSQVPKDREACGVSFNNKYYLCFPNFKYMLVYNFEYKAWVSYEGDYFNFSKMFVNDGILYGINRDTFDIYKFDEETYVDNWNEIEDGYEEYVAPDGTIKEVQKGKEIKCILQTKNFDQSYEPHTKKYDWALLNPTINGVTGDITPFVFVDDNLINYTFSCYQDKNKVYNYREDTPDSILIRDDSVLSHNTIVSSNNLGCNNNSYYNIPIQRSGNTITFGFEYITPSGLTINSLSLRYGIKNIKKNRKGIS